RQRVAAGAGRDRGTARDAPRVVADPRNDRARPARGRDRDRDDLAPRACRGAAVIAVIPQHFGCLVFDRTTSRYLPFDHAATAVLRRAAGDSAWSFRDADFVERISELGWLRPDGTLAGTVLDAEPPLDHLLGPLAVHLEIVAACNLSCTHCFAGDLPRKTSLALGEL